MARLKVWIGRGLKYFDVKRDSLVVFAIAFACVGSLALIATHAATPATSYQAESGTLSGNASLVSDATASGSGAVKLSSTAASCAVGTTDLSCWPNATNTGYENAPGYPGTKGVADKTKLTKASSTSTACPLTFQSHKTYSFCYYPSGMTVGSPQYPGDPDVGQHLTDVHFVGFLVEDGGPTSDPSAILAYCKNDCTFDYFTVKPSAVEAPDVPAPKHGTTYDNSYGTVMNAGWGAYYGYARGLSLKHSNIWGYQSGIGLGGDNTAATPNVFEDNWFHDQGQCMEHPGCLTHADGIGMVDTGGMAKYITINHNNMSFIQDNTNNIAFQEGTYDHLTITNNTFSGDGYTIAIWDTSTNTTFTGNIMTNYAQHYFGWNYGKNFWDTTGSTWKRNKFVWDPTGANPYYAQGPGSGNANPITAADSGKCWVPSGLSTTDYGGGSC
ncbi:hypothetical protein EYC59_04505 [Candidatus Saccharibacteria bacterium]|nr:MAG: hypothetical protein EYC59_04505 [Candidatus Saccharibacteria bacterium]